MELYYREFGQGRPIIILHGLFGFSDNWQTVAKHLSADHLVYTLDLRNHGRSPHTDTHTYAEMAEDVHHFLESRWIHNATVIGHSMGGKVAMQLAMYYPDVVEKLVVVDMDPGQSVDNHREIFYALRSLDFSKISTRNEADEVIAVHVKEPSVRQFLLKNITRNEDGSLSWKMNLPVLWNAYANILAPINGPVFTKPALFVRGGKSNYIKDSDFALIYAQFPNAIIETIPGAGHWVHAEKPAELLQVLRRFL